MIKKYSLLAFIALFPIVFFNPGMAGAVSLDGLMGKDAGKASAQPTDKQVEPSNPGMNLQELMGAPEVNNPSSPSSLLGSVEGDRLALKKKAALEKYQQVRKHILSYCECLQSGDWFSN